MNYLKMDLKRVIKGYRIYFSVLGVMAALFYALEYRGLRPSVMESFFSAVTLSGITLTYMFCSLPYAFCFCEDLEHNYIRYEVIRGNLLRYVAAKAGVVYLSSVMSLLLGSWLFLFICRIKLPWVIEGRTDLGVLLAGTYSSWLVQEHYFIYCTLYALQLGLLAGMLSVISSFLSLFISNKVMVIAAPVCIYQIWIEFSNNQFYSTFSYHAYNKLFEKDWQCFLFVFALSIVPVFLLGIGIYIKLKRRL